MVERVLGELAEHRDRSYLIVDDLHELTSPEALSLFAELLAVLPSHVHAILATRHDLPLRLHRLRLAGELAEIRAADLRFSIQETRDLLDAAGIVLSDAGVALLHQRTEGWAAGLRLALISLAGRPDAERFVAEFSGSSRTVAEYLFAELLERQPDEVRQLLLRTSLLDRVNGQLADLLTGRHDSERILLDLENANAFVVSLDPDRTWFRYHHLFADLLRLELRRTLPAEVPGLHRLAARWLCQHGDVVEAVVHLQAAGEWSEAARLLADHSFSLTLDGQALTIQALLSAFPPGAAADGPDLALARATTSLAQGRLDEAAAHLAVAESHFPAVPPDRQHRLQVATAALKLSLARRRGHLAGVVEQVKFLASPLSGQSDDDIALDRELRAVALMNLGIVEAWSLANQDSELPFAITGAQRLLEAMPRHETAHAALLADILDVLHGSPVVARQESASLPGERLSPSELKVLRYLPTNLSRPEIAGELSVSVNTVNTHIRNIYAKLQAQDRSSAVQRARELGLVSAGISR